MEGLTPDAAEELAERCLEACNQVLRDGDASALVALFTAAAVIELAEVRSEWLRGPEELAERLAEMAHHGGMVLVDVHAMGPDVVAGVAWEDDPATRTAEVRLVPDGDRIAHLEWVR